ncbi:FadR/GntR family transcriptional regulator [Ruegeria jejuensis]|uniref:FadR/GntR family transcriptional regulator n=1 Tax=Ruegeria jejuensis TaxID=3233338 RepID=UPI00355C7A93
MSELLYYDLKETTGVAPSLATHVCRELGRRIVGGVIREGDLVDDETKLGERFGVSKSVIREAVKLLVGKGLLEVRRGSGTRVRRRASWNLLDDDVLAWHLSAEPRPAFLRQLMDIRKIIEPKAAAWAAASGSEEDHAQIMKAQEKMEEEARSVEEFVVADALFHRSVLRAAQNELLLSMEGVIFSALLTSIRLTNTDPRENEGSIPFHREVAEAIVSRNADLAETKMRELLGDTDTRLADAIGTPAQVNPQHPD